MGGDEIAKIVEAAIRAHDAAHTGPLGIGWEAWAIVFATLVGPVLSVLISLVFTWWNDTKGKLRERQLWVFRTLLATRGQEINVDHVRAINLVEIEFYGVGPVIDCWRAYMGHLNSVPGDRIMDPMENAVFNDRRADHLARLLHQMGRHLGFKMGELDLRRGGYAPSGWLWRENQEAAFKEAVIACLSGRVALRVRPEPPEVQPNPPNSP